MRNMIRILAVLAVLACIPTVGSAQMKKLDSYQRTVSKQLRAIEQEVELTDMTHEVWMGELGDDATASVTVSLDAGEDYVIVGVCDEDCNDLDLTLYSGATKVAEDVAEDDAPVLTVSPSSDRTYRISVSMASCSSSPCRYGIAIYAH
jgi:hypothetical protein